MAALSFLTDALFGARERLGQPAQVDTARGALALRSQAREAAGALASQQYGAAMGRGGQGQALAMREAQRGAVQGRLAIERDRQRQLALMEQNAAMQNAAARNQFLLAENQAAAGERAAQAQMLGAGAGAAMMLSDERAKQAAYAAGAAAAQPATEAAPQATAEAAAEARRRKQLGAQYFGQMLGAAGGAGAQPVAPAYQPQLMALSDERAKRMARSLPARVFQYRPEAQASGAPDGAHLGIYAQDLERTPEGASMVERGNDGMRYVDTSQLALASSAMIGAQQREIDALKRALGKGR